MEQAKVLPSAAAYLGILEDTLLAYRLDAFQPKLRLRERAHPKFYYIDPGLARACKGQFGPLAAEERGSLLEGWAISLLKAYISYRRLDAELFYWAPTENANTEVDIVVRAGDELVAIEVKPQCAHGLKT